jgi:hypothetical protein
MTMRKRGLIRTATRAAVISGAVTAGSGRVARRQQQRFARQDEASAGGAAAPPGDRNGGLVASLRELAELKAAGALSAREYTAAKARVLDGG